MVPSTRSSRNPDDLFLWRLEVTSRRQEALPAPIQELSSAVQVSK